MAKKGEKKKDMDELKRELEMDEHCIAIEDLYKRLNTNPQTVMIICYMFYLK